MARLRSGSPADSFMDELTAERLASGRIGPDDVPPACAPVARLLQAATAPGHGRELEGEEAVRRMFVSERRTAVPGPAAAGAGTTLTGPFARRVAVAVVAGSLVLGGGVAAATGRLPDRVQRAAHDALAKIGVDVPDERGRRVDDVDGTTRDADPSGRGKAGRPDRTEDRGSDGGDEPADPGDLGGAPGSAGPPSSTPADEAGPPSSTPGNPDPGPPSSTPGNPDPGPPACTPGNPDPGPPSSTPGNPDPGPPACTPGNPDPGPPSSTPGNPDPGPPSSTPGNPDGPPGGGRGPDPPGPPDNVPPRSPEPEPG
jgi:hypothetical protein